MFWIRAIVQPTSTSTNAPLEADQVLQALINPGIYSPPPKAFSERPSKKKVDAWRFTQQNEFMDLKLLVISELNLRQDQKKVEMASSLNETPKRAVHRLKVTSSIFNMAYDSQTFLNRRRDTVFLFQASSDALLSNENGSMN